MISQQTKKKAVPREAFMCVFQPVGLHKINANASSKPQSQKITGVTRKHTSDFSSLALGFTILALITCNTKKLFLKKSKTRKEREGIKGRKNYVSGKIINTDD